MPTTHPPTAFLALVSAETARGSDLATAVRTVTARHSTLATAVLDIIGAWPASEPAFRELQRVA